MSGLVSHILPSLESLGLWSYWIIAAAAMLESFFVTGMAVPGTLIVDAGGALVRLGRIDFFDLVWFVAIGAAIGGELGFWLGRFAMRKFPDGWMPTRSRAFERAQRLFDRHGGLALVAGRFLGPVAGLVPLAAALTGMPPARFRIWNLASAFPYALTHVAIGYAAGDLLARLGPLAGRATLVVGAIAVIVGLVYVVSAQIRRGVPVVLRWLVPVRAYVMSRPPVERAVARHPRASAFMFRRFSTDSFDGLVLTTLVAVGLYLAVAWADSAYDFLRMPQVAETDLRLARLIHALWTPELLRLFGVVTQLGHWPVVLVVFVGTAAALALTRRYPALLQLCVALGGELVTVRLLKGAFDRPRPDLGYFLETSGSFPSGHATLSIAFWGTLAVILWRERILGATTALLLAVTLAIVIGGSRIYLIEHFLSDVLNGWLIGSLWLVIGFGAGEWLRHKRPGRAPADGWRLWTAAACLALGVAGAGYGTVTANPPPAAREAATAPLYVDPARDIGRSGVPAIADSLTGNSSLPVVLAVTAASPEQLGNALERAGWVQVGTPTLAGALRSVWTDLRHRTDPTALALPMFWNSDPQDLTFRRATTGEVLRLWQAGRRESDGARVYVGAFEAKALGAAAVAPPSGIDALLTGARTVTVPKAPRHGTGPDGTAWTWDGTLLVGDLVP